MSAPIEIELLTRPDCHLCDQMKQALKEASKGLNIDLREINISADPALAKKYGEDIPVLFIHGSKAFKHRATAKDLRERLKKET
ncbi:MAG: glutaredoxin family protein [Acidobacteria bacterium]|nr:MAG: glutaredoxin family protein [Acidobacteriota bacterium]